MTSIEDIARAVERLEGDRAESLVREVLEEGADPYRVLQEGVVKGVRAVGDEYEKGNYFLLELQEGAEVAQRLIALVKPKLSLLEAKPKGTVVMATVKGDLHDIGKNLVILQLSINGYEVVDMGINQAAMDIINKAKEVKADVIGLSSLLVMTLPQMAEIIRYLGELGLRDRFKVIVGGAPTSWDFAKRIGADGWAPDAVQAVPLVDRLVLRDANQ